MIEETGPIDIAHAWHHIFSLVKVLYARADLKFLVRNPPNAVHEIKDYGVKESANSGNGIIGPTLFNYTVKLCAKRTCWRTIVIGSSRAAYYLSILLPP